MKIGNIIVDGVLQAAVQVNEDIIPLSDFTSLSFGSPKIVTDEIVRNPEILQTIKNQVEMGKYKKVKHGTIKFAPVILHPQKILCAGLNYRGHVNETKDKIPDEPVIFGKYENALTGAGEDIKIPDYTKQLDYEGELGVVIGKLGKNILVEKALEHIFGYFIGDDISARDVQLRSSQWLLGKNGDGFYPCGPFITTADEISDPQNLSIRTNLNGEIRQDSNTSYMIFSVAYLISYISRYMILVPGDIISTGTPEGVILGMPEKKRVWIKSSDVVSIEINRLGTLENRFV